MSIRRRLPLFQFTDTLLSIVVNLSYIVNSTQSAPQAASPLDNHGDQRT